jgi:hypothetical protein
LEIFLPLCLGGLVGGKHVGVVPARGSGKLVAAAPARGAVFQFFSRRGLDFSATPSAHALCFFGRPFACFGFQLSNQHKKYVFLVSVG